MGRNIVEKIFGSHLAYGEMKAGSPVGLKVDQVYTQDATGTMAWLQFEAMGLDRVKVPLAVSYVDHNMLQQDYMNPMTISSSRRSRQSSAHISPGRATASATRCTSSSSLLRERSP